MKTLVRIMGVALLAVGTPARGDYAGWKHTGSVYVLTTLEGANLPATARVENFPLLVRLNSTFFDFATARSDGSDLRFAARDGSPLPHQIETWDAAKGEAAIWVRVPVM